MRRGRHSDQNKEVQIMDLAKRKADLLARVAVLKGRMVGIEAELDSHQSPDWEDLATEREGDEVLEGMGRTGQAEMRRIVAALERLADGTYGICAKCGADIGNERLEVVPEAPLCRNCAR